MAALPVFSEAANSPPEPGEDRHHEDEHVDLGLDAGAEEQLGPEASDGSTVRLQGLKLKQDQNKSFEADP